MKVVEPIRSMELVLDIADYLLEKSERDYVLFMTGIYTGLRISDILQLRVRDVKDVAEFKLIERKTHNERWIYICDDLRKIYKKYLKERKNYEYLFKSRIGPNNPITRRRAYDILSDASKKFGLKSVGTHTMRKTFGYFLYKDTNDIEVVREALGHESSDHTKRYIGINVDVARSAIDRLKFFRNR